MNPMLSQVLELDQSGWSMNDAQELMSYLQHKDQISVLHHDEILMWGTRPIVPQKLR